MTSLGGRRRIREFWIATGMGWDNSSVSVDGKVWFQVFGEN